MIDVRFLETDDLVVISLIERFGTVMFQKSLLVVSIAITMTMTIRQYLHLEDNSVFLILIE